MFLLAPLLLVMFAVAVWWWWSKRQGTSAFVLPWKQTGMEMGYMNPQKPGRVEMLTPNSLVDAVLQKQLEDGFQPGATVRDKSILAYYMDMPADQAIATADESISASEL